MQVNPFEIKTPENNSAEEVVRLFVDVFSDFNKVLEPSHTFLNGPRGSGKSMMFRYMLPDCQKIVTSKRSSDLDYFSLYIPIKLTSNNMVELQRLENHADVILNEHLLVTHILSKSFSFIVEKISEELDDYMDEIKEYYDYFHSFSSLYDIECPISSEISCEHASGFFLKIADILEKSHIACKKICTQFSFSTKVEDYPKVSIPLVDCIDYMIPLFSRLRMVSCFPKDKPFYILIDDAGYLNEIQTKILNTWVSYRTTKDVCFKISTQLDYKTFLTTTGKRIDTPHDYSEINIATIYTSSKDKYYNRVESIVQKRLNYYLNSDVSAEAFFPYDIEQQREISEIADQLRQNNYDPLKPYAARDAANRYAVPDYIKKLKSKRSGSTYSYAGFKQLVNVSSGIVRHFLEPASKMFAEQLSCKQGATVQFIQDSIQNEEIYEYSENFIKNEFWKQTKGDIDENMSNMLFNLIDSLGQLFHKILISDCTERRVFSVALTDKPDKELQAVLDKGVQHGFFHEGTIGNKSGLGRNKLYVLSRVLAPYYKLDPNSFAGYQFMSSKTLSIALTNTTKFLNSFSQKIDKFECVIEEPSLFD